VDRACAPRSRGWQVAQAALNAACAAARVGACPAAARQRHGQRYVQRLRLSRIGSKDMAEFTKELALRLKTGGEEGISAFLTVAKIARDEAGVKGLIDWVSVAFKALPKKDRDIAVAMLVDVYFEHEQTRLS